MSLFGFVNTFPLSHSVPFLPFYSFIPEIMYNFVFEWLRIAVRLKFFVFQYNRFNGLIMMEEYFIGGIVGAVLGYFINVTLDKAKNYTSEKIKSRQIFKISRQLQSLNFKEDTDYMAIDHAVPKYVEDNIILKQTDKSVIIPIPEDFRNPLEELGFEIHQCGTADKAIIEKSFKHIGIDDYAPLISEASIGVAKEFIDELNQGKIRFNGYLFGVEHLMLNRYGENEEPLLKMNFYKTDYFTFRVFANLYQKLKKHFAIKGIEDLNSVPAFLSSFGIGCYVIATDGIEEYLIIAHRGNNVIVNKDKYHFSMNEAFSLMDVDIYGNISFTSCLYRGLREELGVNEKYKKQIVDYGFLDLDIVLDRFEMGITCYVRIKFDDTFSMDNFRDLYKSAQDKELETTELKFVPMKEVRNFCKEHESKFSVGYINGLTSLLSRYDSNYI